MRLVQVAKALGMTGQQLRKELSAVDFGIKPTDREVPDTLAQGVIRFVSRKRGIMVDMEALGLGVAREKEDRQSAVESQASVAAAPTKESRAPSREQQDRPAGPLHVLRKLSLEGVPKEAVERQAQKLKRRPTKAEREELLREEKAMGGSKRRQGGAEGHQEQIKKKDGVVSLPESVTVKEFAEKTGVQVPRVIQVLMRNGVMATINQTIDFDTASIVASELGVAVQKERATADIENLAAGNLEELLKDEPENLVRRPPIVVVMGHVDHGKTAILDAVRRTDVAVHEAGGITQHIGASQVTFMPAGSKDPTGITFLDTPGHEAFTAMRARGAQVTDIAVIVVSAEEGIKPTTVEAINHAKEASVPVIVAINKIDKPNANPDRVKGELAGCGLQPEEWGGSTPVVLCSALTKQGIDDLLEHIVLMAELHDLKANPNRRAVCTVIESHLDSSLGPLATVIVNAGTLSTGDTFVCGLTSGRVRTMTDAHGMRLQKVPPSGAVRVAGFSSVPQVGDIFQVVDSERQARVLHDRLQEHEEHRAKRSFADLVSRLSEGKLTQLKVILKADSLGLVEALSESIGRLRTEEVAGKIIHAGVGSVTESDVMMAVASDGVVVAFNVNVPSNVRRTAQREGVEVREYDVVYTLLEELEALIRGLAEPEEQERVVGHLEIKAVFLTKKTDQIVGGHVTDGVVKRLPFRVLRDGAVVGTGRVSSLKHVEKDIKEAKEGTECGLRVETSETIAEGDVLEVYVKELKRKS